MEIADTSAYADLTGAVFADVPQPGAGSNA
jgi:hypothetical protein